MILLLSCIHTPPHPPVEGKPEVSTERREFMDPMGNYCAWEAENLRFGTQVLWSEDPPDAPNGCSPPGESSRTVDIQGQDGQFVSVLLKEWQCCPDRETLHCQTLDGLTGQPVSLEAYDTKNAEKRWEKAQKLWHKQGASSDWVLEKDAFWVHHGHVRFCAIRGMELRVVEVP